MRAKQCTRLLGSYWAGMSAARVRLWTRLEIEVARPESFVFLTRKTLITLNEGAPLPMTTQSTRFRWRWRGVFLLRFRWPTFFNAAIPTSTLTSTRFFLRNSNANRFWELLETSEPTTHFSPLTLLVFPVLSNTLENSKSLESQNRLQGRSRVEYENIKDVYDFTIKVVISWL